MRTESENRIRQTLDYIEKDKLVETNPFFITRLMARLDTEKPNDIRNHPMPAWAGWLRSVAITASFAIFLSAGVLIGKLVTPSNPALLTPSFSSAQPTDELNRMLFELADYTNEQLLLIK